MKIIIHADDFGYSKSINEAVIELCQLGTLSSLSVLSNMPYYRDIVDLLDNDRISIGLHANFTEGKPVSDPEKIPSLVDNNGEFLPFPVLRKKALLNKISSTEILEELFLQYDLIYQIIRNKLVLIDCHHGLHSRLPIFQKAFLEFGKKHSIKYLRTAPHVYIIEKNNIVNLIVPSLTNISAFGPKTVLNYYFKLISRRKYKSVFKMPDRMIVSKSESNLNIFKKVASINSSIDKNMTYVVEAHPSTLDSKFDDVIRDQRIEEYNFLKSDKFYNFIQMNTLISHNDL